MKEGELKVSQKELHRMHVVRLTIEGGRVWEEGQNFWISARQMKRLRGKMKERGVEGFVHGNRGKKPWNKTALEKLEKAIKYKGRIYALLLARLFSFGLPWTRVYIAGQTRISNCDVLFS